MAMRPSRREAVLSGKLAYGLRSVGAHGNVPVAESSKVVGGVDAFGGRRKDVPCGSVQPRNETQRQ
jgi:hypothetical protein